MILCIGPTPAAQRVMRFRKVTRDAVNRAVSALDGAAGKSVNVAKVLKELGERPVATGFLGGDRGEQLRSLLEPWGIEHDFVSVGERTRQCITIIDESDWSVTELVEESRPVESTDYGKLMTIVQQRVNHCRAVIMSGSITPGGPTSFYLECVRAAHEAGALSVVDAQGPVLLEALSGGPGLIKPNRTELAATAGRVLEDEAAVASAMRDLCERGAQRVVVTAGKEPTLAFDGKQFWRITPPRILAVNPIGSGDAFAAGLVWRLLRGDDFGEACRWGSAAGAANALTVMAGEVGGTDLEGLAAETRVEEMRA